MMTANYGDFHIDPPLIIALVLLKNKCSDSDFSCFRGENSRIYDSFICMGMVGLNMVLEAHDNDIDSCFITPHQEEVKKILKVKKEDYVSLLIGFGYQSKNAFQKKRERNSVESITSYEYFGGRK